MGVPGSPLKPEDSIAGRFSPPSGSMIEPKFGMGLIWVFMQEILMYSNTLRPPSFYDGYITEVLGQGKFKVKLSAGGTIVNATSGSTSQLINGSLKKGVLVLLMDRYENTMSSSYSLTSALFQIMSYRDGQFALAEEVPV